MDQLCSPMDLEEDIPANHLVRVVNAAANRFDDAIFDAAYRGGGRDSGARRRGRQLSAS